MIDHASSEDALADLAATCFDVCIVGSGAAGLSLCRELQAAGRSVVLVEAGSAEAVDADQLAMGSEVVGPQPHQGIHEGRLRAFGGTTKLWGGQILELTDVDFRTRPWVAGSGWPLASEDLRAPYARALQLEGLGRARSDDGVWRGLRLAPGRPAGDIEPYLTRWCPEPDFSRLHGRALAASTTVRVVLGLCAVAVRRHGPLVQRLLCRRRDGVEVEIEAAAFVMCLGGVETCRFFLQPSTGEPHPWAGHPLLGAHFQDHVDVDAADVEILDPARFHAAFDNIYLAGFKYHPKIRLSARAQKRFATLDVAATMRFLTDDADDAAAAAQVRGTARRLVTGHWGGLQPADVAALGRRLPALLPHAWRLARHHRAYAAPGTPVRLRVHCEQEPLGGSAITLAGERDEYGMFRSRLRWEVSSAELGSIRTFVEIAAQRLRSAGLAVLHARHPGDDDGLRAACSDANHHMGGMRMSREPAAGLVDPNLRVHGTENLYVCSAAVFPTSGFSNPTHTVIALAARLAAHLQAKEAA